MPNFLHIIAEDENALVINYRIMRLVLGLMGFLFPIILPLGNLILTGTVIWPDSVSEYYYTPMRNVFVGLLCCIALFLFAYKGYPGCIDNLLGDIGSVAALLVAFCQCGENCIWREEHRLIANVHLVSAIVLFIVFVLFCLCLFTKTGKTSFNSSYINHRRKRARNIIYRICGFIMIASLLAIFIISCFFNDKVDFKYELLFESIALFAFGASWLIKAQVILKDK